MLLKGTFKRLTNEMYSRVEKHVYLIDITFGINESIFSGNEQQKVLSRNNIPNANSYRNNKYKTKFKISNAFIPSSFR